MIINSYKQLSFFTPTNIKIISTHTPLTERDRMFFQSPLPSALILPYIVLYDNILFQERLWQSCLGVVECEVFFHWPHLQSTGGLTFQNGIVTRYWNYFVFPRLVLCALEAGDSFWNVEPLNNFSRCNHIIASRF